MNTILAASRQNIEQSLKNCYVTTVSLALTLDNYGEPQNFDSISKQLIKSNPIVNVVQLVPDGVIRYIYPMKGNEAAMNLDILGSKYLQEEAKKSIKSQKIYFAGPLKLKQGGIGIVGRLPIYNNNKFWGFTAVVIKLETLLKASRINSINQSDYYFQFSKKNRITEKEQFFLPSKTDLSKSYYVSSPIPDSDWILYLIAKKPYFIYPIVLLIAFLGFIIALLFGFLITKLLKKPEELRFLLKKQAENLLKNEMKFKSIFDQAPIGFAIIDANSGIVIEANNKYLEMFGYTLDEINEIGISSLTHTDDLDHSLQNIKKLREGQITEFFTEKRCVTKSGNIIWINWTVSPLWETNEKPTSHISFIKDITEKKEAESLIKKSQARYKSLIDTIDGIVWEYDIDTMSSTFVSKKIEDILGYSVENYMASPTFWEDNIHPEDREIAIALSAKVNKSYLNHDYEYRMIKKNGKVIWIRDIMNFVFENGKPLISRGIMIDITLMKEAEKDLNNTFHLVSEQNKKLLNFSYIVSHNLRSHTSNIESIISLIESSESDEERDQMMQLLKSVSNSLDETMNHLNEVVNINTNTNLVTKSLNLNQFINTAKNTLSDQIQLNDASFNIIVPDYVMVNYNPAYLESILFNLISNGIRYRHPERKPVITIKWHKENDKHILEFSDNGIGIDLVRNGDKIFGMYKTFSTNKDSRGIGLYITKNQIEAMRGNITVESKLDIGSTFKIYIQ
jgi:PAS domain S-box-containing protein